MIPFSIKKVIICLNFAIWSASVFASKQVKSIRQSGVLLSPVIMQLSLILFCPDGIIINSLFLLTYILDLLGFFFIFSYPFVFKDFFVFLKFVIDRFPSVLIKVYYSEFELCNFPWASYEWCFFHREASSAMRMSGYSANFSRFVVSVSPFLNLLLTGFLLSWLKNTTVNLNFVIFVETFNFTINSHRD